MKILVCLKQVLAAEAAGSRGSRRDSDYRLNRFDEYAVETALRLRQRHPSTTVTALTVGPGRAAAVLRRALGLGVDQGVHLLLEEPLGDDPFPVAALIADRVAGRNYDLILTGIMSEDQQRAQVGVMLAARLRRPWATAVLTIEVEPGTDRIEVTREMEGGVRECLVLPLPALVTIQASDVRLRYPTLTNMLRARDQELEVVPVSPAELPPRRQEAGWTAPPEKQRRGVMLPGTVAEQAAAFKEIMCSRGLLP